MTSLYLGIYIYIFIFTYVFIDLFKIHFYIQRERENDFKKTLNSLQTQILGITTRVILTAF